MLCVFLFRPLATAVDKKVHLQDCLESGRTAKVEKSNTVYPKKTKQKKTWVI